MVDDIAAIPNHVPTQRRRFDAIVQWLDEQIREAFDSNLNTAPVFNSNE